MKIELSKEIYLNCGIYNFNNTDMLFIAVPSFFASAAWCEADERDERYNNILGQKFEGITSDDCKPWLLSRMNIRRLTENDNIEELLKNSCEEFVKLFTEKYMGKS